MRILFFLFIFSFSIKTFSQTTKLSCSEANRANKTITTCPDDPQLISYQDSLKKWKQWLYMKDEHFKKLNSVDNLEDFKEVKKNLGYTEKYSKKEEVSGDYVSLIQRTFKCLCGSSNTETVFIKKVFPPTNIVEYRPLPTQLEKKDPKISNPKPVAVVKDTFTKTVIWYTRNSLGERRLDSIQSKKLPIIEVNKFNPVK